MKNFTFKNRIKILFSFALSILFLNVYGGEGSKQTTLSTSNRASLCINSNEYGNFARYGSTDVQRLYIRIQNPNNEKVYLGFSRARRTSPTGDEITSRFRIMKPDGTIAFSSYTLDGTTSNITGTESQRLTRAQNGPNGIDGATTGYTPIIFNPNGMPAGDYWIEFESTNDTSAQIFYNYYDITVANSSNNSILGRIYSKRWAFAMDDVDTNFNGAFYVFAPDNGSTTGAVTQNGFVNKINFNGAGFRPWYFNVAFNNTGPGNSGNTANDQKSVYNASDATKMSPKYEVFLNDPDINIWKNGTYNGNIVINGITNCGIGESNINISVFKSGTIEILLDFNGSDGIYTPGTKDVLTTKSVTASGAPPYAVSVPWNGKDGLGNTIAQGTTIPIVVSFGQAAFHFPMYDVEENQYGFSCTTVRPAAPAGYILKFYWDDSAITYTGGTFDPKLNLTGCTPNNIPPGNCHRWDLFNSNNNDSPQYGNMNTINTWWYANRDFVTSNITLPPFYTVTLGTTTNVKCFGGNTGTIQVNVTNGTAPFTYYINGETTPNTLQSLIAGTYNIKVVDANGCSANIIGVVITQPTALAIAVTSKTDVNCYNEITGVIDLTISGGTPNYTYTWKKGGIAIAATSQDLSGIGAGSYEVTVTDSKGCTAVETINITQPADALAIAVTSKTDVNCYNEITGVIDLTISGGTPNYTYTWKKEGIAIAATSQDLSGIGAGSYEVTVTDSKGCTAVETINITQPADALAIAVTSKTDVNCYNEITGVIDLTISGGTPNYTYTWKKGGITIAATSQDLSGIGAGSYEVTVTDSKGCTAVETINITQPADALAIAVTSKTDVNCYNEITGVIDLTISGGTPNYTYTWKKEGIAIAATSQDLSGIGAGSYEVTVTDSKGCTAVETINITQPADALAIAVTSKTDVNCYNEITGVIDLTISGGTPNYTYTWKKEGIAIAATSQDLSGIGAGSYEVTVTDSKGCTAVETINITQPADALAIAVTSKTDVNCYNEITGVIDLTISGGTPNYTYTWKKEGIAIAATSQDLSGIGAGSYEVTVTDSKGCTAVETINITQPADALAIAVTSKTDVNCYNEITGVIDLTISGGTPNYTYTWKKEGIAIAATSQDLSGIGAGSYEVTVTDSKGCTAVETINITQPADALAIAVTSKTDVNCKGDTTGTATASASGGTYSYSYSWNTNPIQNSATANNLAVGTYTVTVTDQNGCSDMEQVIIGEPTEVLTCSITQNSAVTSNGLSDGKATVSPIGGNGGYTYAWDNGEITSQAVGLTAGLHSVIVTDAKGCTTTCSITITEPGALSCSITQDDPAKCYGDSNGKATVTPIGGNGDYTYAWDNGETTAQAVGLNFGTHTVTVTDKLGYTTTCTVNIGQPQQALTCSITQNSAVTSNGLSDGKATVSPIGGNSGYTYAWDNGEITAQAVGLTAGLHSVIVTDAKGCTTTCSITITEPGVLSCSITQDDPVKCYGDSNGKATVTPIGGNGDYTYAWDNGETTAQAVGLNFGTHTVTVTDKLGYTTTCTVNIGQPQQALTCSITQNSAVTSNGLSDGKATVSPIGGNSGYTYAWDNGEITAQAVGLTAGLHSVIVTDAKGCTTTCSITITEPGVLSCSITQDDPVKCYGDSNGKATVTPIGGNGDYTYAWDNGETTAQAVGLNFGTHTVTVTDKLGYTTTCTVNIGQPQQALTCSITQNSAVTSNGLSDGKATVSPIGGNSGYTYAWDNGEITAQAVGLTAGLHSVIVTDAKGCTTTCSITITEPGVLSCSITQDDPVKCYGDSNGKATVTPIGGNGDYTYAWDNGETTAQAVGLNFGTHTVTVTDKLGYTTTCTVNIGQPQQALTCSITQNSAVTSNGLSDGKATVSPIGGNGGYTYAWDNGEITAQAVGLTAGLHSVIVTDAKGCTTTCSITITEPGVLSCSITQDDPVKCYGDSNGKATVTPIGGNGDYTYAWDNGETTAQAVGLNFGTHTVTVTDKLGYTTTCTVNIGQPQQALTCSITQNSAVTSNGLSDGKATVSPIGGNSGYTYAWDNGEITAQAVGLTAGLHSVIVTDAKGCTTTCSITITEPGVLSCSITQDDPVKCYGDSNGKATVTPIGGNGDYTYAWDNGETTAQAVGLNFGTHTVTVTDKLGYKTTCNVTIGQPQQALTCSITQNSAVTSNGLSDGKATVSPIGGNGGYTYAWDNGEITAQAVGLTAGLHSVIVTDAKGCTTTCSITITEPGVLSCSITQDDPVKCYGDSNGKATVTPIGGNGDYTYAWDNGETTAQAVGLNFGTHTVTVTDKLGYTTTCTVNIGQPQQALTCSITQNSAVTSNGLSDGKATVSPIGGNSGYTYAWDNGEITAQAVGLTAGLHSVIVTDAKGCTTTCSITITEPGVLSCSITQDDPVKCYGDSNGKATVTPIGGNGDYTYAWDNGETTAQAVGLNFGTHTVTVTDKLGYTTTCTVNIGQPQQALTCSITQNSAVTSNGLSDGKATVSPIGGNGGYTYAWDNGEITAQAVGLTAGLHSVIVTDAKGCTTTCSITITEPGVLSCSITQDDPVKCYGDSNGKATVTPIGGNGDYTYAWDNGETTAQAVGLNFGTHTVTVTDKLGYTTTCTVNIGQPQQALTCSITQNSAVTSNGLSDGKATVSPIGGNGGYTYAWDNGEITAQAVGLTAGLHSVIVTDAKGCTTTCSITITEPGVLSCSITQDDPVKCYGDSNGKATVTPIGGNGDYTYAWDNGETTAQAVGLNFGTHTVTVTDKLGYTTTCTVNIGQPQQALTCSITQNSAVTSNGLSDGKATVSPIGGNSGYNYAWDNGEITAQAVGLTAGLHSVIVTDAKGCITTCSITITEPGVLSCSITQDDPVKCYGDSNGKATVTPIGGNGDYTYAWDNGETTAQAVGLNFGTHTVTVTDKLGYKTTCNVTIGQPQQALNAVKTQVNVACGGNSTGSATVTVSGGTSPYTYVWNTNPVQNGATANNLLAGNYNVIINDAKGCTITESFIILDGDSVLPVINPLPETSTINCPSEPVFAEATATDQNGTISSLTFEDTIVLGNCAGSYTKTRTWTAKDACENTSLPVSQTIIVQDITAPTWVTQSGTLNKTIECSNQAALAEAQNLFPNATDACDINVLNIDKVSGQFSASQTCSNAGTYTNTWTVKDQCGNTSDTFTQVITIQDTIIPTFTGILPENSTVSCDAVPQPAEMTASDNCDSDLPIVFTETKSDIQNECATNYTLTRKWTTSDCSGNSASYTQIITVRDTTAPTGTAPVDVANLQSITDIPVGSPNDITDVKDNCSATVNITVSDTNNGGNGCDGGAYILTRTYTLTDCAGNKTELVQTFTVENKVSVTAIGSNITCQGASDGKITVTSSPGATVVIRNQNNEVVGNSNLPPGTYTVTATASVNGQNQTCSATTTVVITEPNYKVKISGFVINVDTNTPIANVPLTLIPQGTTPGPILLRITDADGGYSFTGMVAGSYLVQVQDANLNSAYQLYPIDSSLFFTTLEECVFQQHNFEYGASKLPVLGDYVWYDTNGNGIQDEWYDANNDGVVTKNVPDQNGAIDYSLWEWIDLNGDGSYAGSQNVGELNAGGFGNALSANVIVDGPNGYHDEVIVGIAGFWRNRPEQANPYGEYNIKLVRDANFDAVAAALGATGLVKVIPSAAAKKITGKPSKTQMHTVCQTTTDGGYIVNVTPEDLVHLDIDFGLNCKEMKDIIANDDSAGPIAGVNHTTTNVLNVLPNDTLEGVVVTPSDVIITTVTPNEFLQLNPDGSVDVLPNAPVGTLTMVYQICEADETSNCDTATVTITIEAPVMTVTATAICVNDVPYVDYVVTPVNFTPVNGVTIAWANSSNTVITTMTNLPLSGRVLWPGAVVDQAGNGVDWPGWIFENNRWVQGADGFETLRPTVNLTISVNPSETITINYPPADPFCTSRPTFAIIANDDNVGPLSATTAAMPNVISVYTNDTLNGTAVNPSDVTLTTVTADPTGTLTLNPNGIVDVKANTPAGTYTLTYQICENADNGNCDTAIVTVIITAPAPVVANDDTFANIGCNTFGLVGNVLSNDLKGTIPATLQLVNFTLISETTNTKTDPNITIDISGNVNVSSLTPAGTYTYSYRICDKLNAENCDTAVISIIVAPLGVINLTSQACNDDSTLIDLLQLLPANTPLTGQWIDTNGTNALQGGIFNPFGLALGNYIFEYRIADAACPRNIAVTMSINDDCKVLPCGNVVVHNAFSPNGDGINDVFEIDNINELTCYPGNTVEIYNRWGILVFETTDYNNSTNAFDGTSRGRTTVKESDGLPTGTYFYIINYKSLDGNNVIQNNKLDGYLYLSK